MRVLITGATGFCGRPLTRSLVSAGYAVRALVRHTPAFPLPSVDVVEGDLSHPLDWAPLLNGVDAVVHLAAITASDGVAEGLFDQINHRATAALASEAARAGVKHFIFISSVSAQSGPAADHVLTEADDPRPSNAYGRSKLTAEAAVAASGVPFTILRPVMLYGDVPRGNLVTLARLASLPIPLPLGAFRNRRSMLGIENFISAVHLVLNSAPSGETYLVADPHPISIPEIVVSFRRRLGRPPGIFTVPAAPVRWVAQLLFGGVALASGKGSEFIVDPGKLMAAGWAPHDTKALLAAVTPPESA